MISRFHTDTPLFLIGMVVLIVAGLAVGLTATAAPVGAQTTEDPSFQQVTAEVTDTALFGGATEVTFEYQATADADVEFVVNDDASTSETSDGTQSSATVDLGGFWFGTSYPLEVVATVGDQVCTATIERGDGAVVVCDQDLPKATFESASAKATKHSFWTGDVRQVSFKFETEPGTPVELQVDDRTSSTTAEEGETRHTVTVGGWFYGKEYPLNVSASTPNQTVSGVIERGDGWVPLEGIEPQPNFAVAIDADDVVTEGQTVTVNGTVENTGDAAGSQNVTVSIADQSTTQNVSLAPGESDSVSLDWVTEAGDAGSYDATIESADDTDTTTVTVEQPPDPAFFAVDVTTNSPVEEGQILTVDGTVENTGDESGTQTVTVSVADQSTAETVTLAGGDNESITLEWSTQSGDAGNYTATIQSENDSASAAASVTAPPELEAISLELADDSIVEGESTTASVMASYDDGSTVDVTDQATIASDDSSVASISGATVTAESAGSTNVTATYEGATDSAPISVLAPANFAVDVSANDATEGETVSVEAQVENTGGVEATQDVTVSIADQSTTESVTLGAGENTTVTLDWLTEPGDAGTYEATASSADDSDSASVTVSEAPDAPYFAVDLAATSPVVEGDIVTLTATVTNTGELSDTQDVTVSVADASTTESLTLSGTESGTVDLEWQTEAGDAGSYEASASSENETTTGTVDVQAPAFFAVDIDADDVVTEGETVSVDATVENTGDIEATQDVTVAVADQTTTESVTLDGGATQTVSLSWETEVGDAGDYTATADTADDSASAPVTVEPAPEEPYFAVSLDAPASVVAGDVATLTATVTNTGELSDTQDVTLSVADASTTETITLGGNESETITLDWQTDEGDVGTATASATTANDSDSATIEVLEPAFFAVNVTADSPVVEGETSTVTATVTNTGGVEDTQDVTVSVADASTTQSVTLGAGESTTIDLPWTTAAGDAGSYTASVSSADESVSTPVEVLEPAFFNVSVTADSPVVEGETSTVTATVTNTGGVEDMQDVTVSVADESTTESVTLGAGETTTVDLPWTTTAGDAGSYTADASSADDSGSASIEVLEPAFFAVNASADTPVVEGETSTVTATVTNTGGVEDTQDVTVSVADESTTESVTLGAGESTTVDLPWTTAAGDVGSYTADASSADDSGSASIEVLEPAFFAVNVTDTTSPVVEGESAVVTATVTNTGDVEDTQDVTLDPGSDSQSITLGAGASTSVDLQWQTAAGDAGTYTATVQSADDSASTTIEVLEPAFFEVTVTADSPVVEGESSTVTATVTNTGGVEDTQDVTVSVADESTTQSVTLGAGQSTTVDLSWATAAGDAGSYTADASSADDSASTPVEVLEPAFFDVSVSADTPIVGGETSTVTATVTNTGGVEDTQDVTVSVADESTTQSVTLGAGESTTVDLEWATTAADAGSSTASASSADDSGSASIEVLEPAFFAVNVSADTPVVEGETSTVTATVTNTGGVEDTQDVTVSVADESTTQSVTLGAGETTTVDLPWTTAAGDAGSYTASASSADDSASTPVEVLAPAFFDVAITATNSSVESGQPLTVDVDVTNTGDVTGTQNVTLAVDGATDAQSLTLDGGETQSVTLEWQTASGDAGNYTATVSSDDTSDSTPVSVTEPAEPYFAVNITDATTPVNVGDVVSVTATVTNTGTAQGLQTVNLRLYPNEAAIPEDYQDDPVMDNTPVSLAPGASTTVTLETTPVPEYQANSTFYVHVGSQDEADYTAIDVEPAPPAMFDAYVEGQRGYLQTGTNASEPMAPIDFPGCDNFQVTEEELNQSPDYLPAPQCITAFGTIDHDNNTWEGNVSFPTTYMEQTNDAVGEVYVEASITPGPDGASGTWNHDTGEITLETNVSIGVNIYQASHGTPWDNVTASDRITDSTCHIPNVGLRASTEKSFQALSSFPNTSTVTGERLQDGTAYLVSNDFPIDGAQDCGSLGGFVNLNDVINQRLGVPAPAGENEVAFDVAFQFP